MAQRWRESLDKARNFGAVSTPYSLDLLLAKAEAYILSYSSLKMISSFLGNRKHRTKLNSASSNWKDLLLGVPQGLLLGLLLNSTYMPTARYYQY